jgi:hypothetical protein
MDGEAAPPAFLEKTGFKVSEERVLIFIRVLNKILAIP